jgi:hypothetical protein|tara:strand:- start:48 stop:185 length:138 start_codon:yes stop_codon:yes gene_type:complete
MYSRKKMVHGGPHPEENKKKRKMMKKGKMVNRIMYAGGGDVLTPN